MASNSSRRLSFEEKVMKNTAVAEFLKKVKFKRSTTIHYHQLDFINKLEFYGDEEGVVLIDLRKYPWTNENSIPRTFNKCSAVMVKRLAGEEAWQIIIYRQSPKEPTMIRVDYGESFEVAQIEVDEVGQDGLLKTNKFLLINMK